jgi:hypothetical protein
VEEVPHLLHADRAILGVHRFEDTFVSRLKLRQRDGSIAIAIHQRKNDAHGERLHHASLSYGMPHHALSHHFVPPHALPHALPHPSVSTWAVVLVLIDGILLRLLQLLDVWAIGIVFGGGGYIAADQNGRGGRDHEKMAFHRYLLYGYDLSLRLNSTSVTLIPSERTQLDWKLIEAPRVGPNQDSEREHLLPRSGHRTGSMD